MIRKRRILAGLLLTSLAVGSLLLTYRTEPIGVPEQTNLSREYFFRNAEMTLIGEDGRAALTITAGVATRALEGSALELEEVLIRLTDPPWSLNADSAELTHEGADISAEDVRLALDQSGEWTARARRAQIRKDGATVTLNDDFDIRGPEGQGGGSAISGDHIVLEPASMMARTERPVRVRLGRFEFEATGLTARIGEQAIKLESDVRSVVDP